MTKLGTIDFNAVPPPITRALLADNYSKGDSEFSVTQLLGPPQRTWLAEQNAPLERGIYANYLALMGSAIHAEFEQHVRPEEEEMAEVRLFLEIDGVKVSGQFDFYQGKLRRMTDYKNTAGQQDDVKQAHFDQGHMNSYLAEEHKLPVDDICICYIQRDWSESRSVNVPNYRETPITPIIYPYNREYALEKFRTCIADHRAAKAGNPRPCTMEEQWAKPDTFACKKPQNSRARKLHETEEEAKADLKPGEVIERRKAVKTFCESYCGYKHCCKQYQREVLMADMNSQDQQP